jgi:hypothetical protein
MLRQNVVPDVVMQSVYLEVNDAIQSVKAKVSLICEPEQKTMRT